jgi:P63C domain
MQAWNNERVLAMEDDGDLFGSGKAKGGNARAAALSPVERKAIAKKAAIARWGSKATHKGNFKEELGIDVDCYVLDDEQKTAVISQRGMSEALGFSTDGGNRLPRFLGGKRIAPFIGLTLREKLENPIVFQSGAAGSNQTVYGFDVAVLIDLCKAIQEADNAGELASNQKPIAKQASIIIGGSAKLGIRHLVYALSGYDATREEVIRAFKLYVSEEAREYEREFPEQLYLEWYRLYQLPRPNRNKPWKFKHLTVQQVYQPLARSNGKILELTRAQRADSKDRHAKLHQFLSSVGVKALRQHLGQLLGIAQISDSSQQYEKHVRKVFGVQTEMDI